jgi:hypothetical protein
MLTSAVAFYGIQKKYSPGIQVFLLAKSPYNAKELIVRIRFLN